MSRKDKKPGSQEQEAESAFARNLPAVLALGAVTGAICALSGAGGPVLVMPLLVLLISTVMEKTLRRYMPGLWKLLTGDR